MTTKLLRKNPTEVVRAEEGGYNEWGTSFKDGIHADPLSFSILSEMWRAVDDERPRSDVTLLFTTSLP